MAFKSIIKHSDYYNSLSSIFYRCKSTREFKQAHAHLVVQGLAHPSSALRPVVSFSALHPSGDIDYALMLLFRTSASPAVFLFNTVIRGLARSCRSTSLFDATIVFNRIAESGLSPNSFTFTFLFQACAKSVAFDLGQQFHAMVSKKVFQVDLCVRNSIIQFYSVCGKLDYAQKKFHEKGGVDLVSSNSLINGYVRNGDIIKALDVFEKMPEKNEISWNSVIGGLVKFGFLGGARRLFDKMPKRNLVTWVVIISGYSKSGQASEALALFREMQLSGMKPNSAILVSALSACSQLGALENGKWIHFYIQKNCIKIDSILSSALIDMYAKCGNIDSAVQVFESTKEKNVSSYTAIISGLAMNGCNDESIRHFELMKSEGIKPDCISYMAVLSACRHMGWIQKGFHYFNSMVDADGIKPELDHYACMVDLLGRAGLLEEAERFISTMPIEPDNVIWGALLNGCRIHGNVEMGEKVGGFLIKSDQHHDGRYVLLSNIYAESGNADGVEEIHKAMTRRRVKRVPGSSSIEVNGIVHEFVAGDISHYKTDEVYMV